MPDLLERLSAALADRCAIESQAGHGGMAVVFKTEDLTTPPSGRDQGSASSTDSQIPEGSGPIPGRMK